MSAAAWHRIERDLSADVATLGGGVTFPKTHYLRLTGRDQRVGDLRFSNSRTQQVNVLGQGPLGHVVSSHARQPSGSFTPSWSHYDQVGSVIATTDESGDLTERRFADAFGNRIDVFNGLWAPEAGLGYNTKETHGNTGLVYIYQRWYNAKTGTFLSVAPYPATVEHEYNAFIHDPMRSIDSAGMVPAFVEIIKGPSLSLTGESDCSLLKIRGWSLDVLQWFEQFPENSENNAVRHCTWQCLLTKHCGSPAASLAGWGHELGRPNNADQQADIGNNEAGRGFGKSVCDPEDCYSKCRSAWRSGGLSDRDVLGGSSSPSGSEGSGSQSGYDSGQGDSS